jgi:hypothetical protein
MLLVSTFLLLSLRAPQENTTRLGDVKYSILPPDLFNDTQDGRWVLLDGKPLSDLSGLYEFLDGKMRLDLLKKQGDTYMLPDAKGRFIRSMNINGQGDDPDKNRKMGSYQKDIFQTHTHEMGVGVSDKAAQSQIDRARFPDYVQRGRRGPFQTKGAINGRTGEETRPKNIALYTYIKIAN